MTLNWFSCLQSFCAQCVSRWPGWSCCCPRWNPYVWSPNPCKWTSPLMRAHSPFRDSVLLCFSDTKLASLIPITFLSAPSSHPVFRGSHSKLGSGTTFPRHLYLVPFSPYLSASPLHWSATGARVTMCVRWPFPCECRVCKTRLSFTSSCVPPRPVVGVSWMSTQDLFITLNYLIIFQKWVSCYARYFKF